ncbi:MAG: tRNA (adenosine(37)-N6)-dimethylallyltransferase MiaA, partial [Acetatifactor sp.]|nr:tRNA (adenosine(37)-N6)-dimethylallyltransferase MiaA [Acetatifactor sp.]
FNVVVFQRLCRQALEGIYGRGHIPILTGGTGFYIQAVLRDIDFTENPENTDYRRQLEQLASERGSQVLHEMLKEVDPEAAQAIHSHNVKRMIRALEFYRLTGQKISEHNEREAERTSPYRYCYFVLSDDRETLYRRIEERVDRMLEEGLVEEVRGLMDRGCHRDMVSMQGLGYKEILDFLAGEITLEEAVYRIKIGTRHFAKRQLTWFRRESDVIWLNKPDYGYDEEKILAVIRRHLQEAGIG